MSPAALVEIIGRQLAADLTEYQRAEVHAAIDLNASGVQRVARDVTHQAGLGVVQKPVAVLLARLRRGDHTRTPTTTSRPIQTTSYPEPEAVHDAIPAAELARRCRDAAAAIRRGQAPT